MESTATFTNLDLIVIGVLLLSGLFALVRGFVREVLSLLSWIAAYGVAAKLYPLAEPLVHKLLHVKSHSTVTATAAAFVFVFTLILCTVITFLIARLVKGKALTAIDRSLGFLFGVLRGALVVCMVFMAYSSLAPSTPQPSPSTEQASQQREAAQTGEDKPKDSRPSWLIHAKTYPALTYGAAFLKSFFPDKEQGNKTTLQSRRSQEAAQRKHDEEVMGMISPGASSVESVGVTYNFNEPNALRPLIKRRTGP